MGSNYARLKGGRIEIFYPWRGEKTKPRLKIYRHYQEVTVVYIMDICSPPLGKHWPWDGPPGTPGTMIERQFPRNTFVEYKIHTNHDTNTFYLPM